MWLRQRFQQRAAVAGLAVAALALTACAPTGPDLVDPQTLPPSGVGVQMFQVPWTAVAVQCERLIGPAGYDFVLLSPAQEHLVGDEWWVAYQPVSYRIESRLGTRAEFAEMTRRCAEAGVDIIADAVINHMTGQEEPGIGWAGSRYEHYRYPGIYEPDHFHRCGLTDGDEIVDYRQREQVQNCELLNLADLDTGQPYVQQTIAAFLQDLLDLGVAGFRIDAAKHIAAGDLTAILANVPTGTQVIHEVIRSPREPVQPIEYEDLGRVFEFQYARDLFPQLQSGFFQDPLLTVVGKDRADETYKRPSHVPADRAVVFIDNHDTERGEAKLTYRSAERYLIANALMLADDYGDAVVYSGYAFEDRDMGPLVAEDGRVVPQDCDHALAKTASAFGPFKAGEQTCFYALPSLAGLIELRRVSDGAPRLAGVLGAKTYGFERQGRAVIAVNVSFGDATVEVPTTLPDGQYCDVVRTGAVAASGCAPADRTIEVRGGTAVIPVGPGQVAATHLLARHQD